MTFVDDDPPETYFMDAKTFTAHGESGWSGRFEVLTVDFLESRGRDGLIHVHMEAVAPRIIMS